MTANCALAARLKQETASLHRCVEEKVGLPGSVRTRTEYGELLQRLLTFHLAFGATLATPIWIEEWRRTGITLGDHDRSPNLIDDLAHLNQSAKTHDEAEQVSPKFTSFAEALGGLYVIEGSSLGGKILAPAFRTHLGNVPTRYFESYGREFPLPWRSVQSALTRFEPGHVLADQVIFGATSTFSSFGNYLAAPLWQESDGNMERV